MKYTITYKLHWEEETHSSLFTGDYDSLKDTIYQLWKWFGRLDGKLIKCGFKIIEDIQIVEQNYDFESHWKHYDDYTPSIEDIQQHWEDIDSISPVCLEDDLKIQPYSVDITNKVFKECDINFWNLETQSGISLKENTLLVNGVPFDMKKDSKLYEILDIITRLRSYENTNVISYDSIVKYFMNNLYTTLKKEDITIEWIRNILKKKMENIREKLKLEELPISAQKQGVLFRI